MQTKKNLRQEIKLRLAAQAASQRADRNLLIKQKLFDLPAFQSAKRVWFYVALPAEVDTIPMMHETLKAGKKVFVPMTDLENKELSLFEIKDLPGELHPGVLGILEPNPDKTRRVSFEEVDCVIVPGLAFDKAGNRIGRGAGFYDRSLARLGSKVPRIGLAFSFQVFQEIPHERHDQKVDLVLTD